MSIWQTMDSKPYLWSNNATGICLFFRKFEHRLLFIMHDMDKKFLNLGRLVIVNLSALVCRVPLLLDMLLEVFLDYMTTSS